MMKLEQKTKVSKENYWKNGVENTSHHPGIQRTQKQAQPFPWVTTPREHQPTQKNSRLLNTNPMYWKLLQYLDP